MKRLLLLGGGHAHASVLRDVIGTPLEGARVTLVTPHEKHTYSGMLPGLVAGHYAIEDVQFDVAALARVAGAEVVKGSVAKLDLALGVAELADGHRMAYDIVSLNVGSLPNTQVPGSARHALAAKPFEHFLEGWYALLTLDALHVPQIALVGAGAAGVELSMAIRHRFTMLGREARVLLYSDQPSFAPALMHRIEHALVRTGVELFADTKVEAIEQGEDAAVYVTAKGEREKCDAVIWTAGAAALPWLAETGLATDEQGFVLVDDTLRSTSNPEVFAVGDCATMRDARHPKSGVFAVRHGEALARNLRLAVAGRTPSRYSPQKRALALISCGSKYAIADWGGIGLEGEWVWRWKNWLDRRWVQGFQKAAGPAVVEAGEA